MERQILSVQETSFTNKDTDEAKKMYKLYLADDTGAVGCIYSGKPYQPGDYVTLTLAVNKDGRFTARVQDK